MDINNLEIEYNWKNKEEIIYNGKVIKVNGWGSDGITFRIPNITRCNIFEFKKENKIRMFLIVNRLYYRAFTDKPSDKDTVVFRDFKEIKKIKDKWEFVD